MLVSISQVTGCEDRRQNSGGSKGRPGENCGPSRCAP